jgi:hypothetical protein
MNPARWLRIAAALMLLFAIGHTYGFLAFRPPTAEGLAVWNAMNDTHFTVGNATFSYGNFYIGFGLFITVFEIFSTWLTWLLASALQQAPHTVRSIITAMILLQLVSLVLSLRYFAAGPAILSSATTICLALAWLSLRKPAAT